MANGLGTTGLVLFGAAVNFTYAIDKKHDYFPGLLAAGMLAMACAFVNDVISPGIGTALAALFLLTSLLTHGVDVINTVASFTKGK